jgi:hypothetical protein
MTEKDFENHPILFRDAEKRAHLEKLSRKPLGI